MSTPYANLKVAIDKPKSEYSETQLRHWFHVYPATKDELGAALYYAIQRFCDAGSAYHRELSKRENRNPGGDTNDWLNALLEDHSKLDETTVRSKIVDYMEQR